MFDKINNEDKKGKYEVENKNEIGEDSTKYGEFISSYFTWMTLEEQKKKTKKMENMTKQDNENNK